MRTPHQLNKNNRVNVPYRMVFFDSESHVSMDITQDDIEAVESGVKLSKDHDPYLICAEFYNTRGGKKKDQVSSKMKDYYEGSFLDTFWGEVDTYAQWKERTYLFAHNAKYDVLVTGCVPRMVALGYEVEGFSDSNPFILKLVKKRDTGRVDKRTGNPIVDRKSIIVLSSTNYYQTSLKNLGKTFGLDKLDFEHGKPFDMQDAITYCRRDVEILSLAMLRFIEFIVREDLGNFSPTVAGQSFNAFRHRFMNHEIFIHDHKPTLEVERECYAGGRNECFYMGEIPVKVYGVDVNSMYPSVMLGGMYPTKLITYRERVTLEKAQEIIDRGYLLCARCLVDTPTPIFHKKSSRLIFPIGKFWTSLSTPEIQEGLKRGIIHEIKDIGIYEGGEIFTPYVEYFYHERLKAKAAKDKIHDQLYKIFLNSLYGKFGQKNITWDRVGDSDPTEIRTENLFDIDKGLHYLIKVFGGGIFRRNDEQDNEEAFNSFPAIAAHVTAYARMMLYQYIETAGLDNVYYTDTDSLFVNKEGYTRLEKEGIIHPTELGKLDLEKEGYMTLFGCKDYEFTDDKTKEKLIKIKGVSKGSIELPSNAQGQKRFIATVWSGFSDGLRRGNMQDYHNRLQIKVLKREYTKANVNGNTVTPFVFDECST